MFEEWEKVIMPKLELDLKKVYKMPKFVIIKEVENCYLAIAVEQANWVLLKNKNQLEIFQLLSEGKSIAETIEIIDDGSSKDLQNVLIELEAKKFECEKVNYPQDHGMYIYLTNQCNQRCHHCYMCAGEQKENELTTKEILKVIDGFSAGGGKVITFTGGEATLRPDFKEIVTAAKKSGCVVGLLSNGIAWPQEWMEWIKDVVDEVQISIDGFDAESYQHVRGVDTFARALDTVERLVNIGMRVTVAITPLLETLISKEKDYIRFSNELIEKYKGKSFFVKFNTELMDGRSIHPTQEENDRYRESINQIKKSCSLYSELQGFAVDHRNNTIFHNCGYGGLTIASNGDIYFCNLIDQCACQGNVRNMNFEEVIAISQKAKELSNVNNLTPCRNCDLKYLCGGGCRVKNFRKLTGKIVMEKNNKDIFKRDHVCTEAYKKHMYQLMIQANKLFYQ